MKESDLQQVRQRFDEAIAYERAGDFGRAALCYERIIRDFDGNDFDSIRARRVARWYLKWCIPLEAVIHRLQEHRQPVSLVELLGIARQLEEELADLPQELEKRLSDHSQCLCLGRRLWIWADHLEPCVQLACRMLAESQEPVSLKEVLRTAFSDWAQAHPAFADPMALDVLAGKLGRSVECVGREYAVPRDVISLKIEQLRETIAERLSPANLASQIENLFPTVDFSPRLRSDFVAFLRSRLDHRFIQVSDQLWHLKSLLDFDSDSFRTLFESRPLPQTTQALIQHKLFSGPMSLPRLHSAFCEFVQAQLRRNPHLVEVSKDRWLSHDTISALCQRAIQALAESGQVLTTREIVSAALAITTRPPDSALTGLVKPVQTALQEHPEAIQVARGHWWHVMATGAMLDKAWELSQKQGKPKSIHWLLEQCLGIVAGRAAGFRVLVERFDEALHTDTRFLFDPSANGWLAVPPGPTHNNVAYHVLWENQGPLSLNEIVDAVRDRFELMTFQLDLDHDARFQQLPGGRWALSRWVWINDWAFEYLQRVEIPLQAKTIVDKVCQKRGLDYRLAIFAPEDDPRFVPALHGRWTCRRLLTDVEVEQILALLADRGEQGLALESLVQQVIGESADATDAAERLTSDERFLNLNGHWFARRAAFYQLSDDDVERIYTHLASERLERLPLALANLVRRVLGRDWRLTDAEARLRADERFQEIHSGFWALREFKLSPIERQPVISPAVRHLEEVPGEAAPTTPESETLTLRPSRPRETRPAAQPPQQVTVTLGHLDIRHGNLRVSSRLRALLPEGMATVPFIDEEDRAFLSYLDDTGSLLDLRGWIAERRLTYGDKLLIRVSPETGVLRIQPKGERDDRVHQEAVQRQDVERLIEAARQMNKSYRDLMIEVMEFIGASLHREDIYQLVDYHRTASRAHIFILLSLPDCPYEELRYFVPHGNGYWSFDRQRKGAFDMKIRELEAEAKDLRAENSRLQERLRRQREHLKTVELEQKTAMADVGRLSDQMEALQRVTAGLRERYSQLEEVNQQLQDILQEQTRRIETLERQNETLRTELAEARRKADVQRSKAAAPWTEREGLQAQIAALKGQNEQLLDTSREQSERVQVLSLENETLRAELGQMQEQAKQAQAAQAQLEQRVTTLQTENEVLQAELQLLQEQAEEIAHLKARLEQMQRALRSLVGKVFMLLIRLWYGEDLSGLEREGKR